MRIITRGMAITLAALSLTASAVTAPVETVLYSFKGSNGNYPTAGLIDDTQGALYGTTAFGGHIDKAAALGGRPHMNSAGAGQMGGNNSYQSIQCI